ncbi:hypothetical protein RCL_jg26332.t1 [Rhizophagus clarus]|uniref:Uncharacterized protein n=1 Tax=Rhizophagus clarus TaxID=94130 RepID=A0A8H3L0D9_9GLOM|nr:hypothetical protein RCL_jg26332.t1 [Rhizophagus clarus]
MQNILMIVMHFDIIENTPKIYMRKCVNYKTKFLPSQRNVKLDVIMVMVDYKMKSYRTKETKMLLSGFTFNYCIYTRIWRSSIDIFKNSDDLS